LLAFGVSLIDRRSTGTHFLGYAIFPIWSKKAINGMGRRTSDAAGALFGSLSISEIV